VKKKPRRRANGKAVGEINGFPIYRMKVSEIVPSGYNPREITDKALGGLQASVDEFGLTQPIVWNKRTKRIVGGHQRLKTLPPETTTDVVVVDLGEVKEKALNLALNNPHAAGDWSDDLFEILEEIRVEIPDLSNDLRFDDIMGGSVVDLGIDDESPGFAEGEQFARADVVVVEVSVPTNQFDSVFKQDMLEWCKERDVTFKVRVKR